MALFWFFIWERLCDSWRELKPNKDLRWRKAIRGTNEEQYTQHKDECVMGILKNRNMEPLIMQKASEVLERGGTPAVSQCTWWGKEFQPSLISTDFCTDVRFSLPKFPLEACKDWTVSFDSGWLGWWTSCQVIFNDWNLDYGDRMAVFMFFHSVNLRTHGWGMNIDCNCLSFTFSIVCIWFIWLALSNVSY